MTNVQKGKIELNSPEVPELPDLPLGLTDEEYRPLFLYMLNVNYTFKEIYEVLDEDATFTSESIKRELEFIQENIDSIKQSLESNNL